MIEALTAGEVAERLGWSLAGDASLPITGIAYADESAPCTLAVAMRRSEIAQAGADVVLCRPFIVDTPKTMIYTHEEISISMIKAAKLMIEVGLLDDWSSPDEYVLDTQTGAYISKDAEIDHDVVFGPGASVGRGAWIGPGCRIGPGAHICQGTVLGAGVHVAHGAVIGAGALYHAHSDGEIVSFIGVGRAIIGSGVRIGANTVIQRGTISDTMIGRGTVIGDLVNVGHDVRIGSRVRVISQCGFAGRSAVGDGSVIMGQASVVGDVRVGRNVTVKTRTTVTKDVPDGAVVYGPHGRPMSEEMKFEAGLRKIVRANVKEVIENGRIQRHIL